MIKPFINKNKIVETKTVKSDFAEYKMFGLTINNNNMKIFVPVGNLTKHLKESSPQFLFTVGQNGTPGRFLQLYTQVPEIFKVPLVARPVICIPQVSGYPGMHIPVLEIWSTKHGLKVGA